MFYFSSPVTVRQRLEADLLKEEKMYEKLPPPPKKKEGRGNGMKVREK
jgi:hypothetical protein